MTAAAICIIAPVVVPVLIGWLASQSENPENNAAFRRASLWN